MIVLWQCAAIAVFLAPSHATSSDSRNQSAPLDISLVIDRTLSVGARNYVAMLDSVLTLISKYEVGENKTHFAIVTYAFNAVIRVRLDDPKYHSQEALQELIEEMKAKDKLSYRTRTDKALKKVCDEVFVPEKGDRPESPNVLILFTDGGTHKTSAPYGTVLTACEVKHVHRVAVGIGKNIKQSELEIIAGDSGRVVAADGFKDLNNHLDSILETANKIDGGYTEWSEWSNCSEPCGGGLRHRYRNCTNPKPRNNGTTCMEQNLGQAEESEECNTQNCTIASNFTEWTEWGECNVTCGGGMQKRSRNCTNSPSTGGGSNCTEQNLGLAVEEQECNSQKCDPLGPTVSSVDSVGTQGPKSDSSPPKPCKEHLDVGVIIDSSSRIKPAEYDIARRDVIQLAERLQISQAGTHMAILLHSWEAHTWHRFNDNQTISAIRSKAYSLPHIQGGARTDRALELAAEECFGWEDSGDRPDKPNVLVVFTDGNTNDGNKPFSQVTLPLDEAGVRRIVVDIGNGIHDHELRQIADNYSSVVRVSGYGGLYTKLENVMKLACDQQYPDDDCGNWGSYGACSKTCGGGVQIRTRVCPNNNLHLRQQKKHCNTNLCPGQKPCEDTQENCPMRAASGDCWKTVEPSRLFYIGKKFPLWDVCPKSCRRCNVDTSCQDSDPYVCPWWSQANDNKRKCRFIFPSGHRVATLKEMCKKSCRQCPGKKDCMDSSPRCYSAVRFRGCRNRRVKAKCKKSCGDCGGSGGGHGGGSGRPSGHADRRPGDVGHGGGGYPWGRR